ncbi:MAG: PepSY domain-containing protein [Gammaproteobacteria bacterium]|jgi:uncharacterized membrane protein YkoI
MNRQTVFASLALLSINSAWAYSVQVRGESDHVGTPFVVSQESEEREPGPATLEEAIEIALKRYGGQATRSETVERDGRQVHEIRVFGEDGIVRTVRIDPETGAIIPQAR